jgi:di/tripeptidase
LDYQGLVEGLEGVLGADAIYPFAYTEDIVSDLLRLLPVDLPYEPDIRVNETVSSAGSAFELGADDKAAVSDLNDATVEALAMMGEKSFARWRTKFGAVAP